MRTKGEIAQKLKQRRYRHYARYLQRRLSKRCENCQHNLVLGQHRVCGLEASGERGLTDDMLCDPLLTPGRAQKCSQFKTLSKAQVVQDFELSLANPEHLVKHYPDLAALQWVLDEPMPERWWDRMLRRILERFWHVRFIVRLLSGGTKEIPFDDRGSD